MTSSLQLSLSSSLLLPHSVPQNPSAITNQSLHLPSSLCPANHHLSSVFPCCSLSLFSSHTETHPPVLLLYYIPLRLIKLIPSSTCNHVIHTFFQSFVLQPSHLLLCLLHAYCLLFKPPKWLLVTTDCMTLTPLSPLFSSHLHATYNLTWSPWRSSLLVHIMSQV